MREKYERGKFIVTEGGVGSGKTTQTLHIKDFLISGGLNVDYFQEPGGTFFGDKMRQAVQDRDNDYYVNPYASLFAYSASRANLIRGYIIPKLKEGKDICLDRYWYSTFAYQGAEGVSRPIIWAVSMVATRLLKPTLVLHYDLLPEIGMARKEGLSDVDRYDNKDLPFHEEVRRNYHRLKKIYPNIWRIVDASQSKVQVFDDTKKVLKEFNII